MNLSKDIELYSPPTYNPFSTKDRFLSGEYDFFIFSLGFFFDSKTLITVACVNHFFKQLSSKDEFWQRHVKREFSSNPKPRINDKSLTVMDYKTIYQRIDLVCIQLRKLQPKLDRMSSHRINQRFLDLSELFVKIIKLDFDKYHMIFPWLLEKIVIFDIDKQLSPTSSQGTFLHVAASVGSRYFVKILLDAKAKINPISGGYLGGKWTQSVENYGTTPVAYAADYGHADCVQLLCESRAKLDHVSQKGSGDTALHGAATNGHLKCVEILLKFGARTDIRGSFFCRPLAVAKDNCKGIIKKAMEERGESTWSVLF